MVKYYLKGTDEEVKIGSFVVLSEEVELQTPFGKGVAQHVKVPVTQATLEHLIAKGIVEKREDKPEFDAAKHFELIKPYIRRFARKQKVDLYTATAILASIVEVSELANLVILLEHIAEVKNRGKEKGDTVYWHDPTSNYKVGKLPASKSKGVIAFYSFEDAVDAYHLIAPFVDDILEDEE